MGMLAETKYKNKWSYSDPRGLRWKNDKSKFGQKMLEKSGWTEGKGLGLNENGDKEAIAMKLKQDNTGIGYRNQNEDNWIAHQDDFNALLANLSSQHNSEGDDTPTENVQSMETTSKGSRGRVHYKKFTKGKDLSNRTGEDMDSIFGRRKLKSDEEKVMEEDEPMNSDPATPDEVTDDEEIQDKSKSLFNTSTMSVQEYFAQKMAELAKKRNHANSPVTTTDCTNDAENCTDTQSTDVQSTATKKSKKSKKSKKRKLEDDIDNETVQGSMAKRKCTEEEVVVKVKTSKKAKKCKDSKIVSETEDKPTKSKKKKKSKNAEKTETFDTTDKDMTCNNEVQKVKKKKKKSKKTDC